MYNQFILEELKTLKDLLQAGAITQGEFDHLKQILIDGTKASNETADAGNPSDRTMAGDVYENPDEVIRYYSNETKNLLLYKQFDKAYPFVQKILSLRPDHREANRFLQEIKTYIRRDYLIGGAIGVVLGCVLSFVLTYSQDVNLILLCVIPVLGGLLLPRLVSSALIGRVSSRGMRYFISAMTVIVTGCILNVTLASVMVNLESGVVNDAAPPIVDLGTSDTTDLFAMDETANGNSDSSSMETAMTESNPVPVENNAEMLAESKRTQPEAQQPQVLEKPDVESAKTPAPETAIVEAEDKHQASVRNILTSYYQDLSSQKFDANKYYAKKVSRFFNQQDVSPQVITQEVHTNFYTDFQNAVSTIAPNSLEVSPVRGGMYQADFKEVIRCFRKSANTTQTITSRVKVVFDRNMKIIYYSSRPIQTKNFGDSSEGRNVSKMVYFQNTEQ